MDIKYSQNAQRILIYAKEEAMRTGHITVGADHILLALLRYRDNDVCAALQELGVDLDRMKADIDHAVFKDKAIPFEKFSSIHPSKAAAGILEMAGYESLKSHSDAVFPSHIMLAVCHTSGSAGSVLLKSYGVTYKSLRDRFSTMGALQRTDSESETKKTFGAITDKLVELINPESKNITYTS